MEIDSYTVPSRSSVRKAGKTLVSATDTDEKATALRVLSSWRTAHAVPINTLQAFLRKKVKDLHFSSPIVAQRLKRTPSIISKLERFPSMDLDRMQDIGGIRVVVNSIHDINRLYSELNSSKFKHQLVLPPNDYIKEPKPDGYRSLHQVVKYRNVKHPEFNDLRIELQIRTKLQHSWATAVETLGMLEKCSLKSGEGDEKIKKFFKIASALFSIQEESPVIDEFKGNSKPELIFKFKELEDELSVLRKLEGIAVSARHIQTTNPNFMGYHVIQLFATQGKVRLTAFDDPSDAESFYYAKELETRNNLDTAVVLMSAGTLKDIKRAYPNYFLDTKDFLKNIKNITN
jgi:ppGpp synthetase/RelA/SpoT-type nucleotidyltranferase